MTSGDDQVWRPPEPFPGHYAPGDEEEIAEKIAEVQRIARKPITGGPRKARPRGSVAKERLAMMYELAGEISDRIRRGEIDADPLASRPPVDNRPSSDAVKHAGGRGLGDGATRRRSAEGAATSDEG